jgi:hypothetical protein
MSSNVRYELYYTFKNLPDKPLSKKQQIELREMIVNSSEDIQEAVLLLICECAIESGFKLDKKSMRLPYAANVNADGSIEFQLSHFPRNLQQLLMIFMHMSSKK